jgi:hypothetical protein
MENKKQTSVEWLIEEINNQKCWADPTRLEIIIQQAKEMHKQEIVDAINLPREKRWYNALLYNNSGEQYYNEQYGK